jgi:hypothetical protein
MDWRLHGSRRWGLLTVEVASVMRFTRGMEI